MQKLIHRLLQANFFFKGAAFYATLIVILLSLKPNSPDLEPWTLMFIRGDLVQHFICYFGMTVVYLFAFYTKQNALRKSVICSLILGYTLELFQVIPIFQRDFDFTDLIANSLGVLGAWLILRGFFNYSVQE